MQKYFILTILILFAGINYAQQTPSTVLIENGIKLHDEGKYAQAIEQYLLVHENDSNYTRMLAEAALSYLQLGNYDSTLYLTQLGLSLPGSSHLNLYVTEGTAFDKMGKPDKAINVYQKAIKHYPFSYLLYYNLGITLINNNRYKEAEESLKNALMCNPYHASSHQVLGKLMARQKQYTKAFLALETFLAIEPQSSRSNSVLVYLENLSNNYLDTSQGIYLNPFSENLIFEETDHYVGAKIALSKRYESKVDFNASLVKQTQMLLEVLPYDNKTNNFWTRMYLPFFKAIRDGDYFEPFVFTLLRSTNNEDVLKYVKKNENQINDFYSAGDQLAGIRTKRLLDLNGKPKTYNCSYFENSSIQLIGNQNNEKSEEGLWHYFHSNEELSAKGNFISGQKDGYWEYHNNFGQLLSSEYYKDGQLNGTYTSYHENGAINYEVPYMGDNIEGIVKWRDIFGNKSEENNFTNSTRQGIGNTFYVSGATKDSFSYKDDQLSGPYLSYASDGSLLEKSHYQKGNPEGENIAYFFNGKLSYQGNYKDGKKEGTWSNYYSNGNLKSYGVFKDGKKIGEYKEYYYNGEMSKISLFNDRGELHGINKSFNREGDMYLEEEFKNDVIVRVTSFDKEKSQIKSFGDAKGTFDFSTYTVNGEKIIQGSFVEGILSGEWKSYYLNGKVSKHYDFAKGLMDGEMKSFYVNGQLSEINSYREGVLEGYATSYHKNGEKQNEGYFTSGMQDGHWYYYNNDGSLRNYYHFEKGNLSGWTSFYAVDGRIKYKSQYIDGEILQRREYDRNGEVVNNVDFTTQSTIQIKSTLEIAIAEYNIKGGKYEGDYIWFFPNGQIYSKRTYVNDISQGEYISYYENGQKDTQGPLLDGNSSGKWTSWFENGAIKSERYYYDDERDSICVSYHENGKVFREEDFFYGQRQGNANLYDSKGELIIRLIYDQDELMAYQYNKNGGLCVPIKIESADQEIVAYFANGKLSYKQQRQDFVPHGVTEFYNSDGSPLRIKGYNKGLLEGNTKYYHANGKLRFETNYINGVVDGEQKEYHSSGKLKTACEYRNGQEYGKKKVYDESGKLISIEKYWSGYFIGYGKIKE